MNLGTIKINDQDFGNIWSISLISKNSTRLETSGKRPIQFHGVHALLENGSEIHLLSEDDGHFRTVTTLTLDEINLLHKHLSKLVKNFIFKDNFKVTFDTHIQMNRKFNDEISCIITNRNNSAPLIELSIKGEKSVFDVNWLPDLIKVLDIEENKTLIL